jgi:hypothetical protein
MAGQADKELGAQGGGIQPSDPTVAVIIPTYNRARLLPQALDSILEQTRRPDDVLVIDDGSSDDTAAVVAGYHEHIRCDHQPNSGKPAALNRGLAGVATDYVWIMDDDDVAAPDALERHLGYLKAHPEVDYTYSGVWCFAGDGPPPPAERCRLWQRQAIDHSVFFIRALEEFPCNQQTMLVPLACYRTVGPYDEKQTFAEDYEMILRLARRYRAGLIDRPTIFLRQHAGDRGPAQERFAAAKRFETWRPYEKRLFESLRDALPLAEYLPRPMATDQFSPAQLRRALLQRACVMARHGLFAPALSDLEAAVSQSGAAPAWSAEERQICGRMLNVEPVLLAGQGAFLRRASHLLRRHAPVLHQAAGAGLSWSGLAQLRAGSYRDAVRMSARLVHWLGPVSLSGIAATKLTHKLFGWQIQKDRP